MLSMWALGLAASLLRDASQAAEFHRLAALALASVKQAPQSFHAVAGAADVLASAKAVQAELPVSQLLVSLLCKQGESGCLSLQAVQLQYVSFAAQTAQFLTVVSWEQSMMPLSFMHSDASATSHPESLGALPLATGSSVHAVPGIFRVFRTLWCHLQEVLPLVAPNLAHPSSAMRVATLRLLCCFQQPLLPPAAATEADRDQGSARGASFAQFLQIESQVRPQYICIHGWHII